MKTQMKIILALLLAVLFTLPLLAACSDPEAPAGDTTSPIAATDGESVEETTADPFEGINFNDTEFT
ncbi:MAG: hypothetical protein J5592_06440, partial [Clostridia bacterium]|nr:hypothetical protein [Clostridia bacterium]